jgi:2-polyprenyl-3-methyl-5-hydroxy-6-metoxy-1,4-benzoquinol methylase
VKPLDRFLQAWRFRKVAPFLRSSARVLDIGSADGALFRRYPGVRAFVGVDPDADGTRRLAPNAQLLRGVFPDVLQDDEPFDVISLLAVLEHVPPTEQPRLAAECARRLTPGGVVVVTVPSPVVDTILALLKRLHLIDGMSVEQHYGFDAHRTVDLFTSPGLSLIKAKRFQLGVNNLFVFEKRTPQAG